MTPLSSPTHTSSQSGIPAVPRLILLTHEFQPFRGGVATYCAELAQALQIQGQSIEVWAPDYGPSPEPHPTGLPVIRLRGPGNLRASGLYHLARSLWQRRRILEGSILLLPSVGAQMVAILLSLLPGWPRVPIALLWHGSEFLRFQRNPFWRILALRFFRRADFYLAASPYTRTLALESPLLFPGSEVTVIPCAPSSDAHLPVEISPPDSQERIRILTLARLHPRKGQKQTIQALSLLSPNLKSRIVYQLAGKGDPAYLEELRHSCEKGGVPFEFLGEIPSSRLSSVYAQCDIYAMTSRSLPQSVEGFGITYLEAGLQSKPVVACRSGGVEGAVIDGVTGLLVDENDLLGLTRAFSNLISNPSLRARLGEGNRAHASSFSWDRSARLLLDALRKSGPKAFPTKLPQKKG